MAKHKFQTEVSRLLHLIIHSLYSHPEIFLRELISNASDALDRLKYLTLTDEQFKGYAFLPRIDIAFDQQEQKWLSVSDSGIGMDAEELERNLGTIANSGTRQFLDSLAEEAQKGSNLIGQFGVGFYSCFMVSDRVEVVSRRAGQDKVYRWLSDGKGEFEIQEVQDKQQGTTVKLFLNERGKEYASRWRIEGIVRKYSNHIPFPIHLHHAEDKQGAGRADQLRLGPLAASPGGDQGRGVQRVLQDPQPRPGGPPGLHAHPGRGGPGVHDPVLHSLPRARGPVLGELPPGGQAVRQEGVHHRRREGAAAHLPALRARGHRLRGSAPERQPGAAAGKPGAALHPHRGGQEDPRRAGKDGPEHPGEVRGLLQGVRDLHKRGALSGSGQPGKPAHPGALQVQLPGGPELALRLQGAHGLRAEGHLLPGRGAGGEAARLAAAGGLQEEGPGSAAHGRRHRRAGGRGGGPLPGHRAEGREPQRRRGGPVHRRGQGPGQGPGPTAGPDPQGAGRGGQGRARLRPAGGLGLPAS